MRVVGLVEPTPRSAEILGRRDEKPNKSRKHQKLTTVYTKKFNAWDVNRKMAKLGGGNAKGKNENEILMNESDSISTVSFSVLAITKESLFSF